MRWLTRGENFHTEYRSKVQLSLPKFLDQKLIKWLVYVDDSTTDFNYDIIIGRDLLKELGILLDFGKEMMIWQDISIRMKDSNATMEESYHIQDASVAADYDYVRDIMDAKYEAADL